METVADIDGSVLLRAVDEAQAAAASASREERPPVIRLLKPAKLFHKAKPQRPKQTEATEQGDLAKSLAESFEVTAARKPKEPAAPQVGEWKNFIRLLASRKAPKAGGHAHQNSRGSAQISAVARPGRGPV